MLRGLQLRLAPTSLDLGLTILRGGVPLGCCGPCIQTRLSGPHAMEPKQTRWPWTAVCLPKLPQLLLPHCIVEH